MKVERFFILNTIYEAFTTSSGNVFIRSENEENYTHIDEYVKFHYRRGLKSIANVLEKMFQIEVVDDSIEDKLNYKIWTFYEGCHNTKQRGFCDTCQFRHYRTTLYVDVYEEIFNISKFERHSNVAVCPYFDILSAPKDILSLLKYAIRLRQDISFLIIASPFAEVKVLKMIKSFNNVKILLNCNEMFRGDLRHSIPYIDGLYVSKNYTTNLKVPLKVKQWNFKKDMHKMFKVLKYPKNKFEDNYLFEYEKESEQ